MADCVQFYRFLQRAPKIFLRQWHPIDEDAMSEVEFDQLLDAVSAVVANDLRPDTCHDWPDFIGMTEAANDNDIAWPMIPFPAGWNAVC